ncbi:terminase small subunit [uncultured Acetobacterium sp.]|uniref:terminase small subunit n=1 Tax=uncultured Acetobacterium sp. TaxID=217139 RepID=UPI0025FBA803|nr:terminase small subunit [uncultured Acetobacterium sp.]
MTKDVIEKVICSVFENPDLTDKQRDFCLHYICCFNATKSYQKAYGCNYAQANAHGARLLINGSIKSEIQKLMQIRSECLLIGPEDIFQLFMEIAFADISDIVSFNGDGVYLRNSEEVDGRLISEMALTDNGIKVKLLDRMKALQWLSDHMDLATLEQRIRIDKLNAEIDGKNIESELFENDGFIEALGLNDGK